MGILPEIAKKISLEISYGIPADMFWEIIPNDPAGHNHEVI